MGKIFDNAHSGLLHNKLLKLGSADQIIPTDLLDRQFFGKICFHIFNDPAENLQIIADFGGFDGTGIRDCVSRSHAQLVSGQKGSETVPDKDG